MQVEIVKIGTLKPHPKNPRIHPDAALERLGKSIKEYGWTNPVLVSSDGFILAGHARVKAAKLVGISKAPIIRLPLEGARAEAYLVADNKLQEMTEWDFPKLSEILAEVDVANIDIEVTGFDQQEIDELLSRLHQPGEGQTDEDAVPDVKDAICKKGDLWQLGNHRLLCGDATVQADVDKLMGGEGAVLMVSDPPYGVNYETDGKNPRWRGDSSPMANDNLGKDQGQFWTDAFVLWPLNGDAYIFSPSGPLISALAASIQEAGITHHQWLIWAKHQFVLGRSHYHYRHEHIYYGWKGKTSWNGSRTEDSVWDHNRPMKSPEHPTMKPAALCEKAITNSSKVGNIVLDPFGGSGSTLIACEKLGRRCYMMEIDPHYCDVIIKRWEDYTGKKAKKEAAK